MEIEESSSNDADSSGIAKFRNKSILWILHKPWASSELSAQLQLTNIFHTNYILLIGSIYRLNSEGHQNRNLETRVITQRLRDLV